MIAIIDYGAGNLFNVRNALDYLGFESEITSDVECIKKSDKIILPGVGAFPDAMRKLNDSGLVPIIKESVKPLLGICLGMQMLFEYSEEFEKTEGLGFIDGYVEQLIAPGQKIPHMGWSDIRIENQCKLTKGIKNGDRFYFVHAYKAATPAENVSLYTVYGEVVPALVSSGNIYGTQFHPEKSGDIGLKILKNFADLQA